MSPITFPSNTGLIISQIRSVIGRNVTFYTEVLTDCPVCTTDPTTHNSTDAFCPVCHGLGTTVSGETIDILAHITWAPSDRLGWVSAGTFLEGDANIQVELTDTIINLLDTCRYVIVDTKKMTVRTKVLRGVQPLNRVIVALNEEEE